MKSSRHTPLPARLTAARAVMTCGVSGSGKTRLARRLEAEGFTIVSADRLIWQRHGDGFPDLPAERRRLIFMDVAAEIDAEVTRRLAAGERVVVDATFCKRQRRDEFRAMCAAMDVEPVLACLEAPRETLVSRLAKRRDSGPDDQRVTVGQLDSYLAHFERPEDDEPYIKVDSI